MDQEELRRQENKCIQEWAPWCTATCPVHVDVRAMTAAIAKGDFQTAAQAMRRSVPFPGIISHVCDHPCESVCKRREAGESIAIRDLEKAALAYASSKEIRLPPIPKKDRRVAVVGAGLSGLTAAHDLARKGYQVTVFEATEQLGGCLALCPEDVLPASVANDDYAILSKLAVEVRFRANIGEDLSLEDFKRDFDAVYVGIGRAPKLSGTGGMTGPDMGESDPKTFETKVRGVFAGGSAVYTGNYSPITSVSHGRRAAISMDRYVQNVSLTASREHEGSYETRLFTSMEGIESAQRVGMSGPQGYSLEEARSEGVRCLQCECMECVKVCEFLAEFKGYPKKYVRQIYNNLSIVMGERRANKLINSCTLCGLCEEVCPEDLNMGEVCKAARNTMVEQGKMPPSAHEFALQDMEFSNSDKAVLVRHQPGMTAGAYLFFPGCQLSGTSPDHVRMTYDYLKDRLEGGVGLILRCCGAPADWAGRAETFSQVLDEFRTQWIELGRPELILACSSCYAVFKNNLPDARLVSLWEVFDRWGLPEATAAQERTVLAIHDPCTSRHEAQVQESVRRIVNRLGHEIIELPLSRNRTECCGFGGLVYFADRPLGEKIIRRCIEETPYDLLAYCAVCRDHYTSRGKRTRHLLDLIFGQGDVSDDSAKGPDYSLRRENRFRLKNTLLTELWGEEGVTRNEGYRQIRLILPEKIRELMEQRMILVEDLQRVIQWAEKTGIKLVHRNTGHSLAHYRPGTVTYWVEYSAGEDGYIVHNAYSHRMEVLEGLKP